MRLICNVIVAKSILQLQRQSGQQNLDVGDDSRPKLPDSISQIVDRVDRFMLKDRRASESVPC